eukprot:264806-Rhodomonas_salina.1
MQLDQLTLTKTTGKPLPNQRDELDPSGVLNILCELIVNASTCLVVVMEYPCHSAARADIGDSPAVTNEQRGSECGGPGASARNSVSGCEFISVNQNSDSQLGGSNSQIAQLGIPASLRPGLNYP